MLPNEILPRFKPKSTLSKSIESENDHVDLVLAAFRYPHRTRPNSGPDQIILVLKLSTEPVRSWCCLHIHAKFCSAAAVGISGPISVS